MSTLVRFFEHLLTYQAGLGAVLSTPADELPPVDFMLDRMGDIMRVSWLFAELSEELDGIYGGTGRFPDVDELFERFPWIPTEVDGRLWPMRAPAGTRWLDDDLCFAAERLVGPNPMVIQRVSDAAGLRREVDLADLLLRWDRTRLDNELYGVLSSFDPATSLSITLEDLRDGGALFVCDYGLLDGLPDGAWQGTPRHAEPCIGLFASHATLGLLPLAIQVGNQHGAPQYLPTETDPTRWAWAKSVLRVADLIHHEMVSHLGRSHFRLGEMVARVHALIPGVHPVGALMEPHTTGVVFNNNVGMALLMGNQGMVDELLGPTLAACRGLADDALATCDWFCVHPAHDLRDRGVVGLPFFPYRDDAEALWDAFYAYAHDVLDDFYGAVPFRPSTDVFLQHLDTDLRAVQPPARTDGLPVILTHDVDGLAELVADWMFMAGPQHAAVNYPQWDFTMNPAGMPGAHYTDPTAGPVPLVQALPPVARYVRQIEVLWLLSQRRVGHLGDVPPLLAFEAHHTRHLHRLGDIEHRIRTSARPWPYPYLMPSLVPLAANV